jgi:hypothetical protein
MNHEMPVPPQTDNPDLDRWMRETRKRIRFAGVREHFHAWVADSATTVFMGVLPQDSYVLGVHLHVTEAFDSDGADNINVGWASDTDAIFTATDVSTTGVKSPTLGANNGYNSTEQTMNAYYVAGGSAATAGKALVIVEFARVDATIA